LSTSAGSQPSETARSLQRSARKSLHYIVNPSLVFPATLSRRYIRKRTWTISRHTFPQVVNYSRLIHQARSPTFSFNNAQLFEIWCLTFLTITKYPCSKILDIFWLLYFTRGVSCGETNNVQTRIPPPFSTVHFLVDNIGIRKDWQIEIRTSIFWVI